MTQKEKIIIRKAIQELMANDGNFSEAITALCRLVGLRYSAGELSSELSSTTVEEFMRNTTENQEFKAPK